MKRARIAVCVSLAIVAAVIAAMASLSAAPPDRRTRSVSGTVTDRRGNALKGAAVQLENPIDLSIISFNTRDDGRYSFHRLSTDVDFTITAKYKRWFSKSKVLSKFDSKENATIDLEIPVE